MKLLIIALLVLVAIFILYRAVALYHAIRVSKGLMERTIPYENLSEDQSNTLLIIGDSTGVGVGADTPEDTVAAQLAHGVSATYVENLAVSGAVISDLSDQVSRTRLDHYDTVLIQIGANDIVKFRSTEKAVAGLAPILESLRGMGAAVYFMSAGDVGKTKLLPFFLNPFYSSLNKEYHAAFAELAREKGVTYVNLGNPEVLSAFTKEPKKYLAIDGFHPSSAGYVLWYAQLQKVLIAPGDSETP